MEEKEEKLWRKKEVYLGCRSATEKKEKKVTPTNKAHIVRMKTVQRFYYVTI